MAQILRAQAKRFVDASGRASTWSQNRARLILAAAMVAAVILILWWASDRTFALDEWGFVTQRGDWTLENLFRPSNGHLLALPLVAYKALLSIFGAQSHLPFTLLTVALDLLVAGLVYVIAARRLHPWIALIPAVLLLFYGSGWEVLVNTAAMQNQFGIAAGLGMILCLDRRWDVPAALLLVASLASFTIGLAFAAGGAVRLLLEGGTRGRFGRIWVVAGPVALWVCWLVWARKYHQGGGSLHGLGVIESAVFDQLSAITAGLTGLFQRTGALTAGSGFAETTSRTGTLVFVLVVAIAFRATRPPRLTPAAWGSLAALIAYLLLIGYGLDETRAPESSRYVYMGSLLLLVVGIEFVAGLRVERRWLMAVVAVGAASLYSNAAQINVAGNFFQEESEFDRAELAALDFARPVVAPAFVTESESRPGLPSYPDLNFSASEYFESVDRFGSAADTEQELAAEPEAAREAADDVSIRALGVAVEPAEGSGNPSAPPLVPMDTPYANVTQRGPCLVVRLIPAAGSGVSSVAVPPGGIEFSANDGLELGVRRYADFDSAGFSYTGTSGLLKIPADLSAQPWIASVTVTGPATVCPA